jgi:DNA-binding IclR family transcriptional regulator
LPQLARQLDLPKSSTHCLLLTLERRGYLHKNETTNRYKLGWKLFRLSNGALAGLKIREQAAPFLHALMKKTSLTVHMAVLEQLEAVLVAKVEPPGQGCRTTWVGKKMDLHATGVGKALLAYLSDEDIAEVMRKHGLSRYNDNTITSFQKLKREIEQIGKCGYATEDEEGEVGYRCVGAPIFDHVGAVPAAISVAGTTSEITEQNFAFIRDAVKECAASISHALGYVPTGQPTPQAVHSVG